MGFEQFMAASPKAKVLNASFVLLNFLAWIACCVGFGGPLMSVSTTIFFGGEFKGEFYWNHYHDESTGVNINLGTDDCVFYGSDFCDKCAAGGKGFVAFQVFAFLGLMAALFLSTVRILGVHIAALEPTRKVLFFELIATAANTFNFFLSVCIYGGTCYHAAHGRFDEVTGTGFGFTIACFFLLVINCVIIYNIRADSSAHLGSSAGSDYTAENDANTTSYNPPASYQYNGADPSVYAGSYNSDVMPASQQQTNIADNNL